MFKVRSVLVLAALTLGSTAAADIINVGPGDSIQAAIDAAVDGDEIVVAPGTYNEVIDFVGKAITVRSSGGPEVTTIDAAGLDDTVVKCVSGEGPGAVLDGFTLTGGIGALVEVDPGFNRLGGGMYIAAGSNPTVTHCTFQGNAAQIGGGMYVDGGSPTVINCTFAANTAAGSGGGLVNSFSDSTVTNCTFSENASDFGGGGMLNTHSSPTVTNSTFTNNSAGFGAGGMSNVNDSSPMVINCTFTGNAGSDAGAMHNVLGSSPMVINCAFSGNEGLCGGIRNEIDCNPIITNCTLSGNTALGESGAMCNVGNSSPTVTNCILWGNTPDEIFDFSGATIVRYSDIQGGFTGTGNINADPLLVDPDNGDLRLGSGSPCIDAGDNTAVPLGVTTDLDGNPRFIDDPDTPDTGDGDPPIVDMGAFEFQGAPCPWDLNGDGVVNVLDLIQLVMSFGPCEGCPADFDDDGFVGVLDLITLLLNFGPCPGTPCVWDVNGDGIVDESDLQAVTDNLGPCDGCPEDVNGDGVVNGQDAAAVATHFGPCP